MEFEAFANSNHSIGIWSVQIQIRSIRKGLKAFECKFKHSKVIGFECKFIQMQIRTIRKGIEALWNSSHSKGIQSIQMQILTIRKVFEAFWKC